MEYYEFECRVSPPYVAGQKVKVEHISKEGTEIDFVYVEIEQGSGKLYVPYETDHFSTFTISIQDWHNVTLKAEPHISSLKVTDGVDIDETVTSGENKTIQVPDKDSLTDNNCNCRFWLFGFRNIICV